MMFLFDGGTLDVWLVYLLVRAIVAVPVAHYARRKGYNFWSFVIAGVLFSPIACLAILLALPKIVRYVSEDEAEALAE